MVSSALGRVVLGGQAQARMAAEARRSSGTEAGGIIVGRPTPDGFYAHDVLVLDDEDAGYAHFTRDRAAAQDALDSYMISSDDPHLGYVGDWHTHPSPVGPSTTDKSTMNLFAQSTKEPILLVVAALGPSDEVQFHATISRRLPLGVGTRTRPAIVHTDVKI
jgi:hypothetical protein